MGRRCKIQGSRQSACPKRSKREVPLVRRAALRHSVSMRSKKNRLKKKYDSFTASLQGAGLRPTRQRLALAAWLFNGEDKHVTAEHVHAALEQSRVRISLATVYNTLNNLKHIGLLRQFVINGGQVYFDTNTSNHYHFYDESRGELNDISASAIQIGKIPRLPAGKRLTQIDIVLRVEPIPNAMKGDRR